MGELVAKEVDGLPYHLIRKAVDGKMGFDTAFPYPLPERQGTDRSMLLLETGL